MYRLSDYDYPLPGERIAQHPCDRRSDSRLLRLERPAGTVSHHHFSDLDALLRFDDLLVINDTRVIPARLHGTKETGGKIEILILEYSRGLTCLEKKGFFQCQCMIRASRSPGPGARLFFADGLSARVEAVHAGRFEVRFFCRGNVLTALKAAGEIPLPPYIHREDTAGGGIDARRYQTVYAEQDGAVAAPTAGLHFTGDLMDALRAKGMDFVPLTLHVGHGTFAPVRATDIREHDIHSEFFSVPVQSARQINLARQQGRRIVAVGTTCVRTLEFATDADGRLAAGSGQCDLFIYPGYRFKMVDAMITNFHLPCSTLLMLVSAFAGRDPVLNAYQVAVADHYRFFSYGDAMLLE